MSAKTLPQVKHLIGIIILILIYTYYIFKSILWKIVRNYAHRKDMAKNSYKNLKSFLKDKTNKKYFLP